MALHYGPPLLVPHERQPAADPAGIARRQLPQSHQGRRIERPTNTRRWSAARSGSTDLGRKPDSMRHHIEGAGGCQNSVQGPAIVQAKPVEPRIYWRRCRRQPCLGACGLPGGHLPGHALRDILTIHPAPLRTAASASIGGTRAETPVVALRHPRNLRHHGPISAAPDGRNRSPP